MFNQFMDKQSTFKIIVWAVIASVFVNVFFSRLITARISTMPLLNRLGLLSPQAPIVIRENTEVRISSEGEINDVLQKLKNRVSQIGVPAKAGFQILGSATNFTSDGIFVTSSLLLPPEKSNLQIRLPDGRAASIVSIYTDDATGLAFIKTELTNIGAAPLADTSGLKLGDRILFFTYLADGSRYYESQVNFLPEDKTASFGFQNAGIDTKPGMVIVNYKGEVLGVWHNQLIASEKLKSAFELYLNSLKSSKPQP